MTKRLFTLLLLTTLLVPGPVLAAANLLTNPGFEGGYYKQDDITELAVPNGWRVHYIDGGTFPGIADGYVARRPETVVWYIKDAPLDERSLFFLDGDYTLKMFKPWAPVYLALSQDVSGLQAGTNYEFIANVFVDVVDHYEGGGKVPPSNEPEGVVIRTGVSGTGAAWRDESQINYSTGWTAANTSPFHQRYLSLHQAFTATSSQMTVWVELISKYGYINNGFFMDRFEMAQTSGSPRSWVTLTSGNAISTTASPTATSATAGSQPTATTGAATQATEASQPTATSPAPPASTPTATPFRYTVQRGDTLFKIARRFGTTISAIARANRISNTSLIYTGQTLTIPTGSTSSSPAPTATPQPQTTSQPTAQPTTPSSTSSSGGAYVVQRGDTLGTIAQRHGVSIGALAAANGLTNSNLIFVGQVLTIPPAPRTYVVQRGDTLGTIAQRFGTTAAVLQNANGITNPNFIFPGQVLTIP